MVRLSIEMGSGRKNVMEKRRVVWFDDDSGGGDDDDVQDCLKWV